jgi:hypothetical protein
MKEFGFVAYVLYGALSVGVTTFVIWLLPPSVLSLWEQVSPGILFFVSQIPMGWTLTIQNYFYSIVGEINEYCRVREAEITGRHRKFKEIEDFFSTAVQELREVNEGRRTPVTING